MSKCPLTALFIFYFAGYKMIAGKNDCDTVTIDLPIPSIGFEPFSFGIEWMGMSFLIIMAFVILGTLTLIPELKKALKFSPEENRHDVLWSWAVAILYLILVLMVPFFRHQLFVLYLVFTWTDAILGQFAMFGILPRGWNDHS